MTDETPKLTHSQRRALRRNRGITLTKQEIVANNAAQKLHNFLLKFPDSSRDSLAADSRSYRERAHVRIDRADKRRAKRKKRNRNLPPSAFYRKPAPISNGDIG